jgi:aspartate kinase
LAQGEIAVVAGFQGITEEGRISTLGRGGSDTTAVALAAAFDADRCDIYTDIDGVYTCDPRIVHKARKLHKISFEEMLEMASLGAKVLQTRSVELAMKQSVRLRVLSSFTTETGQNVGTYVVGEEEIMEKQVVSGVTYSKDEAQLTLRSVADRPGVSASIFGPLAEAEINVDMIVQNISDDGTTTDITFTVAAGEAENALSLLHSSGFDRVQCDKDVTKVSVVGLGMRSHAGVAQTMFHTLAKKGINIKVISTSEIKISVLIDAAYTELALRALHSAYGLDAA